MEVHINADHFTILLKNGVNLAAFDSKNGLTLRIFCVEIPNL